MVGLVLWGDICIKICIAFGIAGLGICHAMGHPLSALLNKAHGQTLSTMLPHMCAPHFCPLASKLASSESL